MENEECLMEIQMGDDQWARFGKSFYEAYRRGGFARMTKREIDILVFHLIEENASLSESSETELAQQLGSTPSRIRGLRNDARFLYWDDTRRTNEVRRVVFGAIANELFQDLGDHIGIQVSDPFVRQIVVDVLERNHTMHDTSFNRAILKIDRKGFAVLMYALLSEEQKEVLDKDRTMKKLLKKQNLHELIIAGFKGEAGSFGKEMKSQAIKDAAKWMLEVGKVAVPAFLAAL